MSQQDTSDSNVQAEKPKVKMSPVQKGTFAQSKKKLTGMLKTARQNQKQKKSSK